MRTSPAAPIGTLGELEAATPDQVIASADYRLSNRCRSLHKKCQLISFLTVGLLRLIWHFLGNRTRAARLTKCSNCEAAGATCRGGGSSEIRFRFANLGQSCSSQDSPPEKSLGVSEQQVSLEKTYIDSAEVDTTVISRQYLAGYTSCDDYRPSPSIPSRSQFILEKLNDITTLNAHSDSQSLALHRVHENSHSGHDGLSSDGSPTYYHEVKLLKHFFAVLIPWVSQSAETLSPPEAVC